MIKNSLFGIVFLLCITSVTGQEITGLSTVYDHSFSDWIIFAGRDFEGRLEPVYRLSSDWTEWNYRVGERSGYFEQKYEDDPGLWELAGGGELVTMRPVFPGDLSSWRVSNDEITIEVYSVYRNYPIEWEIDGSHGSMTIEQVFEGDPRDWVVQDELDDRVPWEMRLAAVCIAVFHSIPKL